ncbi:MAG: tetratricopeptide repeat protein [Fibrobacter sp.]|nr:tetratricopeptide repeat protein [Fibrobacter sp.]
MKNAGKPRSAGLSYPLILITGFIIACVLFFGFLIIRHISRTYSPSIVNAEKYLKRGKINEAFTLSERISSNNPGFYLLRGKIWLALSIKKQDVENWGKYGLDSQDWLKGEEIDNALLNFKEAVRKDPSSGEARYYLGVVYREKGWYSEAERQFEEALSIEPSEIKIIVAMASLMVRMDRLDEAESELREAFRIDPEDPSVMKNMAFLFRFYKQKPDSALVWLNRYLNNVQEKDLDINLAKKEFQELLERYPEFKPSEPQDWRNKKPRFIPRR